MVTMTAKNQDGPIEYFSYRSQSTDRSGRFEFKSLGGGEHRLSVYANGYENQDLLHRFDAQSDEIHLRLQRNTLHVALFDRTAAAIDTHDAHPYSA